MKRRQPTADYLADLERRAAEHVSYHDVIQPERCTPIDVPRLWEIQRDKWLAEKRRQEILRKLILLLGGILLAASLLVVMK